MNDSGLTNRSLVENQYRDASNLSARALLHERFSTNPRGWHRWVFDQIQCPPNARILELGCGNGLLWTRNQELIPAGWEIILSDLSPGMLRETRAVLMDRKMCLAALDAQSVPFRDSAFDAVVANHMLYHVPEREKALAEIRRVLRDGGVLYAATNGKPDGPTIRDWVERARRNRPAGNAAAAMHADFSLESGASQLAPFFATVELHRYPDSLQVTEVDPLVDYAQSTVSMRLDDGELAKFRRLLDEEIERRGAVHLAKSAGIFAARKAGIS